MYVVAIFALALLSPLPFISPFMYDVQNVEAQLQSPPFGPSGTDNTIQSLPSTSTIEPSTFTLTSSSDNINPSYAKAGDTITVNFTTTVTLHYNATATIHGRSASVSIFDNILIATITILETDPDGYANFDIDMSNDFGTISVSNAKLTTGTAVFVDKHVPVIKINGPPLVYVTEGDSYVDFGASVTDADPNYLDDPSSNSSSISTATVGTYTIEYYSDEDGAGNIPFNKTRTVSVQSSSLTADASYVDSETILLRFDTSAPAFYSGSNDLATGITVDSQNVTSAFISGQIKSVTTFDNTIPSLNFLTDFSEFGHVVAPMGDLNQDGYEDIVVGIPGHISLTNKGGAVAILHLGENAQSILDVFLYDGDSPNMPLLSQYQNQIDSGGKFGFSLDNMGDINGDGFSDIIVGTQKREFDTFVYGGAYVLFLGPNGSSILGYAELNHTLPNGPRHIADSEFGSSVVNMGDLNNDGIPDVTIAAAEHDHNGDRTGILYIIHLGSDGLPIKTIPINITELESQYPSINPASSSRTWSIENMGDLNGDGFTDLMMASSYVVDSEVIDNKNIDTVADNYIYILHLGENGESILDFNQISMHDGNLSPTPIPGIENDYGNTIKKLEDVNGDGYTDLLISAPNALDLTDPFKSINGLVHVVLLGENGTSVLGYYEISSQTIPDLDLTPEGFSFQDVSSIGYGMAVLGDLNSDGALEIIVGAKKFIGINEVKIDGQGALHVISLAGPNDEVPHVVIKTNNTNTNKTSNVVLDQVAGKLQLRSLSPTASVNVQADDNIVPEIYRVTTLTNTSLNIEFSEDIETDTEFGLNSFRVSGTDQYVSINNVLKTSSNTVLLNVTRISSSDTPLVEIFDSSIKDNEGNVMKYSAKTAENSIGSYPLSAFWGYNWQNYTNAPVVFILFEADLIDPPAPSYLLNATTNVNAPHNPLQGAYLALQGLELYQAIRFNTLTLDSLPFALNDTGVEITLAPNEIFLDTGGDPFVKNYTLPVDTFRPPKILYAETSEARFITLTVDRYVEDVDKTDFFVSDSLSVQDVSLDGNRIILDMSSMPGNSTPTVTIIDTITDKGSILNTIDTPWYGFVHQAIVNDTQITAIDGSHPIFTAEYDNLYTVNLTYSEPIDVTTIDESDFKILPFRIESVPGSILETTTVKRITNLETAADGLSSIITFDRKLNPGAILKMIGLIDDTNGTPMLEYNVSLSDSIPPTMSSAKTISSTLIEITFNEDLDNSGVNSNDFTISDNIVISEATALYDVVLLTTSTIPEDATPTITLSGSVEDHTGNVANSGTVKASDAIAPSLSSLSITSNNANTEYAKSGDEITLVLVANEPVSYVDGTIFETIPQITRSSNGFDASVTITDTTSNGYPTFAITIVDDAGNTKTITQSDLVICGIVSNMVPST